MTHIWVSLPHFILCGCVNVYVCVYIYATLYTLLFILKCKCKSHFFFNHLAVFRTPCHKASNIHTCLCACVCVGVHVYQRNPISFSAIFHSLALSVDASGFSVSYSVFRCSRQIKSAARQVLKNNKNDNNNNNNNNSCNDN